MDLTDTLCIDAVNAREADTNDQISILRDVQTDGVGPEAGVRARYALTHDVELSCNLSADRDEPGGAVQLPGRAPRHLPGAGLGPLA